MKTKEEETASSGTGAQLWSVVSGQWSVVQDVPLGGSRRWFCERWFQSEQLERWPELCMCVCACACGRVCVCGSSLLVLESRRACWGPRSWSWRAAGRAGVLTPGPGEPQGVLGSSLLVPESRRACWGPPSWSWRAAGRAGVLTPGPGEPQGVLGSSLLVLESLRACCGHLTSFHGPESVADG